MELEMKETAGILHNLCKLRKIHEPQIKKTESRRRHRHKK